MMDSSMAGKVRARLLEHATLMMFEYKGAIFDVDPFSRSHFRVHVDGEGTDVFSIDDVMNRPFFFGKSLAEIADEVEFDEW